MQELIEAAFLHIDVVGDEVRAGHFDLIGPDDTIILPQAWDQLVQPGWSISMQMWPMNTIPETWTRLGAPPPPVPVPVPVPEIDVPASGSSVPLPPLLSQVVHEPAEVITRPEVQGQPAQSLAELSSEEDEMSEKSDASTDSYKRRRRSRFTTAYWSLKAKISRWRQGRRASWATSGSDASEGELSD
jgi:hypothetical protein